MLLLPLLAGTPIRAQEPHVVQPGSIATGAVAFTTAGAAGRIHYHIEPAAGVRLVGPADGALEGGTDTLLVPITFGLPRDQRAGALRAARVFLTLPDGAADSADLVVRVAVRRRIAAALAAEPAATSPGGQIRLRYRIRNLGNATDTVLLAGLSAGDWDPPHLSPTPIAIAPGEEAEGTIGLRVPRRATPGDARNASLSIRTGGAESHASALVRVVHPAGLLPGFAQLPATLFVGSALDGRSPLAGGAAFSLSGTGQVVPGTRLSLDLRHLPEEGQPAAFRQVLAGPRMRLAVQHAGWDAALGDVYVRDRVLTGTYAQGRGLDLHLAEGAHTASVLLARPLLFQSPAGGHLAGLSVGTTTPLGGLDLSLADMARPTAGAGTDRTRSVGVKLRVPESPTGHLTAELALQRLSDDRDHVATGPALNLDYALRRDGYGLTARLRHTPAALPGAGGLGNEAYLSGMASVDGPLAVQGWVFSSSTPLLGIPQDPRSRGGSLGLRVNGSDGQLDLLGNYRRTQGLGLFRATDRRTLSAFASRGLGAFRLDGTAEVGQLIADGAPRPLQNYRADAYLYTSRAWGWLALTHNDEFGAPLTRLDVGGSLTLAHLDLEAGTGTRLDMPVSRSFSFWSGTTIHVAEGTGIVVGAEYQPWQPAGSRWRTSIGIRRALPLPLPVPVAPLVAGSVFEDRDGNGRRDPGEPTVPGVTLQLGPVRQTTNAAGRFAFSTDVGRGHTLEIDAGSLPPGTIVPPAAALRGHGHIDIPIVPTGGLRLTLFLDENGNAARDPAEPAATGALVSLIDAAGRRRDAVSDDDGTIEFRALPVGVYDVRISARPNGGRPLPPVTLHLRIETGRTLQHEVAAPTRRIDIRMRPPAPGEAAIP